MSDALYGDDARVLELLRAPQHIGVLGVSRKPHRASYRVTEVLIAAGYRVSLINPSLAGQSLFDRPVYATLADATAAEGVLDWVDVFRAPEHLAAILDDAIACGARGLWGQLEVKNPIVAQRALDQGLKVVMDRCPAIELPRLRAHLT